MTCTHGTKYHETGPRGTRVPVSARSLTRAPAPRHLGALVVDLRGGARAPRRFVGWQTFFDFGDVEAK